MEETADFQMLDRAGAAVPDGYRSLVETVLGQLEDHLEDCLIYTTVFDTEDNLYRIVAATGDESFGDLEGLELPLDKTYCFQMVTERGPRYSARTAEDPVYSKVDPHGMFGAYAGAPIEFSDGTRVGSLCVMSREPEGVPESVVPMISILAGTLATALEREQEVEHLREVNAELREQAATDSLTGAANRRAFEAELLRSWRLARRGTMPSYLFVADLDRLKQLNDEEGHLVGDLVLSELSDSLTLTARDSDVVGRLGGDEFGVILHGCSSDAEADAYARRAAEELRARMAQRSLTCTASVGYANLSEAASPERAIEEADLEMYERKVAAREAAAQGA